MEKTGKITGLLAQDVSGDYHLLPADVLDLPGVVIDRASDIFTLPSGEVYTLSTARYEYGGVVGLETKLSARLAQVEEALGSKKPGGFAQLKTALSGLFQSKPVEAVDLSTKVSVLDFEEYKKGISETVRLKAEGADLGRKLDIETFEEYKKAQELALSLKRDKPAFVKGEAPYCTLTNWEAVELVSYNRRGNRSYDRYGQGYVLYGFQVRNDGAAGGGGLVEQVTVRGCRILKP